MSRIIQIGSFFLLALLGALLVKLGLTIFAPSHAVKAVAIGPVPAAMASNAPAQSYDFSSDPFRQNAAPAAPVDTGEDAPETTLKLKLTGLITGPNGSAHLRTPAGAEARYEIGEEIQSGVTLQAVNADFIVLDVEGQVQRLTFEREDALKLSASTRAITAAPSATNKALDLKTFLSEARIFPARENGKVTGMRVRARSGGAATLSRYGLQDGDVITRIGNVDLTQGRPDFAALTRMAQGARQVELTLLRGGQTQTLMIGQ